MGMKIFPLKLCAIDDLMAHRRFSIRKLYFKYNFFLEFSMPVFLKLDFFFHFAVWSDKKRHEFFYFCC